MRRALILLAFAVFILLLTAILYRNILLLVALLGLVLVVGGILVLLLAIPWASRWAVRNEIRSNTEFYSARAALWCIAVGLALLVIMSITAAVEITAARIRSTGQGKSTVNNYVLSR